MYKTIRPYNKKLERVKAKYSFYKDATQAFACLVNIDPKYIYHARIEDYERLLETDLHPLLKAVKTAFYDHLPLVLTPDSIWYCISNAVAIYINENAEKVRKVFVNHEGKKELIIERPDFLNHTDPSNPWHEVVDEFVELIGENTNSNVASNLQADFTTTTKVSKIVSEIVVMDAMSKYFDYTCVGGCGIPEIRVTGEKSDWERMKEKIIHLVTLIPEIKDWTGNLYEIIDEFINVFDDKIDADFWKGIYHYDGGSGGTGLSGWLIGLFPYLEDNEKNQYCWNSKTWRDVTGFGLSETSFSYKINKVSFKFKYGIAGPVVDMLFVGGFISVNKDPVDYALTPKFGYCVVEKDKVQKSRKQILNELYNNR